jgi:hypothetical protein
MKKDFATKNKQQQESSHVTTIPVEFEEQERQQRLQNRSHQVEGG